MRVAGNPQRSIALAADGWAADIVDQTRLPHEFRRLRLETLDQAAHAIRAMQVRGAPLIGATAAYGLCLALRQDSSDSALKSAVDLLLATRPTGVNLRNVLEQLLELLTPVSPAEREQVMYERAAEICEEDVAMNRAIGRHGGELIGEISQRRDGNAVQVLTHCNAGWLAAVDWGTALAPVYLAHSEGVAVHVWVDETRPRNQGAALTAWELGHEGIPHTVITDNAGGHLMQRGRVDLCLVGTDRTTATGDVCNKIGTYLKALAAHDNEIPFYAAVPSPSIDWAMSDGRDVPIEERDGREVSFVSGRSSEGSIASVQITPDGSPVANFAFDVTPARLVTGLITERGVCSASPDGLLGLFPERG
jgi:methylthioribose-1-phosphate isomerase